MAVLMFSTSQDYVCYQPGLCTSKAGIILSLLYTVLLARQPQVLERWGVLLSLTLTNFSNDLPNVFSYINKNDGE